jgi:thiamine biosynthesis protein ThiS
LNIRRYVRNDNAADASIKVISALFARFLFSDESLCKQNPSITGMVNRLADCREYDFQTPCRRVYSRIMKIMVNGNAIEAPQGASVSDLLAERKLSPDRVAVELNRRLLKTEKYGEPLKENDEVEIVTFVGGG